MRTIPRQWYAMVCAFALTACGDTSLLDLHPKLEVEAGTKTDAAGHYLLDFGNVTIGTKDELSILVTDSGRVKLVLDPVTVAAPFGAVLTGSQTIPSSAVLPVPFSFAPTAAGDFQATVVLNSNGGSATIDLKGTGTPPSPSDCQLTVSPTQVAFGNVTPNSTKTSGVRLTNTSSADCSISGIALAAGTNSAFSLSATQPTSITISAMSGASIGVTFAPKQMNSSFQGTLDFAYGPPGTNVQVPLTGSATESCPDPNPDGSCPTASAPVYVNTQTALFTFDPSTHGITYVADFSGPCEGALNDIAIDSSGLMLGASFTDLYSINPTTGACGNSLASLSDNANALTISPDNQIVVAGSDVELLDRTTYALVKVLVPSSAGYNSSGDIVALPDGYLYWTVTGDGNDQLIRVDPTSGATEVMGTTSTSEIWGLAYAANTLFGFTDLNQYLAINPANASGQATTSSQGWYGATSNPTTW